MAFAALAPNGRLVQRTVRRFFDQHFRARERTPLVNIASRESVVEGHRQRARGRHFYEHLLPCSTPAAAHWRTGLLHGRREPVMLSYAISAINRLST